MSKDKTEQKRHVLVLDDEEGTRNILEKMLFRAGYNVSVVATGKQALQRIQAKSNFDLIISDIRTPLMTGIELMTEIRKMGVQIPAIFISGSPNRDHIARLKALGVENVFVKPFKTSQLVECIRSMIGPKKEEAQKEEIAV